MKKSEIIKIADLLSFISLSSLISTGILLKFTLPPKNGGASVWGLTRHDWGDVHFYIALIFLVIISLHLFLHLSFIKKVITGGASREHKYRIAIGAFSLVVLIALLFAPVVTPVDDEGKKGVGKRYEHRNQLP